MPYGIDGLDSVGVVGAGTMDSAIAQVAALAGCDVVFAGALGKTTWKADDKPGFVSNHILMPWINEGIRVYDEGVASGVDIDCGMKLGTNAPMELADRYNPTYLLNGRSRLETSARRPTMASTSTSRSS